jgi:ribonuclease BN (tRNA processing enzyme)
MKIQTLGSGSAFTLKNYQTSFLINDKLLFDCGGDARFALRDVGLTYKDIKDVFISHLHGDHVHGLEWLGFTNYFDPSQDRPNLYLSEVLVDSLWNDCLKAGMGSLQGKIATLSTYFKVEAVQPNELFVAGKLVCTPVQTIHIMNGFLFVPSFGLMVSEVDSNTRVYFTGDTQYAPAQIMDFYKMADVIIHDCEYLYINGNPIMSRVHAHYEELKQLPGEIKAKMYLAHYQDAMMDVAVATDGFAGKLNKGEIIKI